MSKLSDLLELIYKVKDHRKAPDKINDLEWMSLPGRHWLAAIPTPPAARNHPRGFDHDRTAGVTCAVKAKRVQGDQVSGAPRGTGRRKITRSHKIADLPSHKSRSFDLV